jgi:hypothetical protein
MVARTPTKGGTVRSLRLLALGTVIALVAAMSAATAVAQGGGGGDEETPEATDVGITEDQIRIAVLADSDNQIQPGLFQGSFDAMEGFEEYINDNGGLAGREVVVDQIDTKLNANETRNAIIKACEEDFALVGTTSLFVNNVDDMTGCVDQAGQAIGIPDFPVLTSEAVHQCSPVSNPINPPSLQCDTIDDPEETYIVNTGATNYYREKFGKLHGVYMYPSDLKSAKDSQVPLFTAQQKKIPADQQFDISNLAPQSVYTPVAQAIKNNESTFARSGLAFNSTVAYRKEAKLQGVTSVKVFDCSLQCYDRRLIEQGGADVEDQFVYTAFLPFLGKSSETKSNKMLNNFVKFTGKDNVDGFGIQAWSSGLYFAETVNRVVEQSGVNGLTRQAVLDTSKQVNQFDADGMLAPTDVGDRTPSDCFVLMQVQDGEFVRVFPKKKGTFSCSPKNRVTVKLDLLG